jgi:hypothetical protein
MAATDCPAATSHCISRAVSSKTGTPLSSRGANWCRGGSARSRRAKPEKQTTGPLASSVESCAVHSLFGRVPRIGIADELAAFPALSSAENLPLPQPVNEPYIEAIVERIRAVVSRQSAGALDAFAATLGVAPEAFNVFINERDRVIEPLFLIDIVAAFAGEFAVDPQWILTGQYDGNTRRQALLIGEDRTAIGARALRLFIQHQYERARNGLQFLSLPSSASQE